MYKKDSRERGRKGRREGEVCVYGVKLKPLILVNVISIRLYVKLKGNSKERRDRRKGKEMTEIYLTDSRHGKRVL